MPTTSSTKPRHRDLDGAILETAVGGMASPSAMSDAESYLHTHIPDESNSAEVATESEPLLTPGLAPPVTDAEEDAQYLKDWEDVPRWRRPSVGWLLGPFFVFAVAFGGAAVPRLNVILDLICREYYQEQQKLHHGGNSMMPVIGGNQNEQCQIPQVHARTSTFMTAMGLIAGLLSALTSPRLGSLSDRYGRRFLLSLSSYGLVAIELATILVVKISWMPISVLLVGSVIDGLCGSFMLAMALSYSYGTDCTTPRKRAIAFGIFQGALFGGIAIGPVLGGLLAEYTGNILNVFYVALGSHVFFIFYVLFILPESLSPRRLRLAKERHRIEKQHKVDRGEEPESLWAIFNPKQFFEPLGILYPRGPGSSPVLRVNLVLLAIVDCIIFGVGMGGMTVILLYAERMFSWGNLESSIYLSIVNSTRVTMLFVVLPSLVTYFRPAPPTAKPPSASDIHHGADMLDIHIMRFAITIEAIGYLMFAAAPNGVIYTLAGAWISLGGAGSPTVQSALTKHVPNEKTGQLLGALALLHSLCRVIAPTLFNLVYALTVGKQPKAVFVALAATFSIAFVCSWLIKPGVTWHEASRGGERRSEEDGEREHAD